jgi:hypothetical protein
MDCDRCLQNKHVLVMLRPTDKLNVVHVSKHSGEMCTSLCRKEWSAAVVGWTLNFYMLTMDGWSMDNRSTWRRRRIQAPRPHVTWLPFFSFFFLFFLHCPQIRICFSSSNFSSLFFFFEKLLALVFYSMSSCGRLGSPKEPNTRNRPLLWKKSKH